VAIAENLKNQFVVDDVISSVSAVNGYLNFTINRTGFGKSLLEKILSEGDNYGSDTIGNGKTICIDYSSINIAKPFHIGHLSTTVIGSSLCKILRFLGYKVVGINHLGDYGTQFGKLIVAYKKWGDKESIEKGKLRELMRIYVKFHDEAEKDDSLNDEARRYFKLIEDGDTEANELFEWFKEITLKEVDKVYQMLNVSFDSYAGESFFNDKMQPVIDELKEKGLLKISDGASIVDLEEYGMAPCLILKKDGSSLYATRDLATAVYRKNTYDFYKCLYVVAYQQNLHFKQFFKVLELMGKPWAKDLVHVAYGMVSMEDGAMSTRQGKVVFLEDVIEKCIAKASAIIEEKNPNLENKETVARQVGTGSVIFGALCNNKIKDIVFSYDKVLNFDGETCPYVQYTGARCNSVLAKGGEIGDYTVDGMNDEEYAVLSLLGSFSDIVKSSAEKYEPSIITRYAVDLAEAYNKFYISSRIIDAPTELKNMRLALTKAVKITLTNATRLLGIEIPEKM
jgi:arginyl-tRNA synthetase